MLDTHDILMLLCPLVETPPWTWRNRDTAQWMKFENQKWKVVKPINLLKLGVSMIQIGEKDQGCKMIDGVEKQYPKANQSVIQKAKYESQKFECKKQNS